MRTYKKGISLIVLVVTIIVLAILATTVIISLSNTNIISKANDAVSAAEFKQVQEIALLEWSSAYASGLRDESELETRVLAALQEDNVDLSKYDVEVTEYGVEVTLKYGVGVIEEISITTAEQMYALGRLLSSDSIRTSYMPNYTTDGSLQNDLALFEYPEEVTTDDEKVEYLMTTSYSLENDVELKLLKNAYSSNLAIGSGDRPFKGFFNGNENTISITEYDSSKRETFSGIFGYVDGATIINTNVELANNIDMIQGIRAVKTGTNIGMLVAEMNNTKLYNNHVNINGKSARFVFDTASVKISLQLGGLVGLATGNSEIKDCSFTLENNSEVFISNTADENNNDYSFGGIVAQTLTAANERIVISDCNVNMTASNVSVITPRLGLCGGIVAIASRTTIDDTEVTFDNSSMGMTNVGDSYVTTNLYYSLATGGIVGFGGPGSSNTEGDIGKTGIIIENCKFSSTSTSQKEILYSKIESGLAPNVGGVVGLTFNNASIINTDVEITNGTLIAEKTEEDSYDVMGSTSGGIIGRLEHTGVIKGCTVTGNSLNIVSKSTGKEMYAGGLVGIDMGPYHKNQISIENSNFIGNGTSNVTVELVKGSAENSHVYAGGIAGSTTYIMKDCSVSGVTLYNKGTDTGVSGAAVGKLAGRFTTTKGLWVDSTYFTPNETRGVIGCTISNATMVIEDNNSGVVSQGEQYGTDT